MIQKILFWIIEAAFLFGIYRLGVWLCKDPERIAGKYLYYDHYLKPRKVTLDYFRALGAFFSWIAVFVAGLFLIQILGSAFSNDVIAGVLYIAILAWLIGSFWVARALRKRELEEQLVPASKL